MADFLSSEKLESLRKESPEIQQQVLDKYFPTLKNESPEIQKQVHAKYGLLQTTTPSPTMGVSDSRQAPEWAGKYPNLYGVAGAALETARPIVEGLGLALGGAAGTAAGPGGTVAGAGLGYAGAKRALNIADVALGNVRGKTIGKEAIETTKDFATGASMEMGGQLLPKALTINPEEKTKMVGEVAKRMGLSVKTGVPLTRAQVTQSKADSLIETQLRENIGSASTAQKFDAIQKVKMEDLAKNTQESMGGPIGKLEAGQIAQESGKSRYGEFMKKAGGKYEAIPAKDIHIKTDSLVDTATGHMEELGQMQSPVAKRLIGIAEESNKLSSNVGKIELPSYTVKTLLDDYSTLGKMAKSTSDYNKKRMYNSLREAMLEDLANFSNNASASGEIRIKQTIDEAMQFYKKGDIQFPGGINTFRERQISNALKTKSPEDIVGIFMKPRNVSDITRLKNASGENGFQAIKRAWFQDLISRGEEQTFSHNRFVTAFNKYDQETLNAILTKEERTGINKLYEISKIISQAEKLSPNPSGTGRTLLNSAYMWINHPVRQALTQLTAGGVAKLYFGNNRFQTLLADGLKTSATSPESGKIAQQIISIAGKSGALIKADSNIKKPDIQMPDLVPPAEAGEKRGLASLEGSAIDPTDTQEERATRIKETESAARGGDKYQVPPGYSQNPDKWSKDASGKWYYKAGDKWQAYYGPLVTKGGI